MDKILTVIVPTYNMQDYMSRGLDSLILPDEDLMNQLEVLIINDGSKDNSSAIAHGYESKYPNTFRVIDKENGNYGSCINRGLKEATGKYIRIMDADDWNDTANFAKFLNFLLTVNVDLVLSDFDIVNEKGVVTESHHYHVDGIQRIPEIPSFDDMWWMHAVTYRRAIFDGLNYHQTEGISYTDEEWIFIPMTRVKSVAGFPHVVYKYLVGRDGQTVDPAVYARTISHEIICWKSQQMAWEQSAITGRGDAEEYLKSRLKHRAVTIYRRMIFWKECDISQLEEFDAFVKEHNPKLYQELNDATLDEGYRLRYVYYWRKCRNNKLIQLANKLEYFIKRKLHFGE